MEARSTVLEGRPYRPCKLRSEPSDRMRATMQPILAAALAVAMLFCSASAQASKASPPRSNPNTVAAWHSYCAELPASLSQEVLCGIRSHDKAIAVSGALLVAIVLGWVWIDTARRSRSGGREWESNPPRVD